MIVTDYVHLQCLSVQKLKELLFYWALDLQESIVSYSIVVLNNSDQQEKWMKFTFLITLYPKKTLVHWFYPPWLIKGKNF